MKRFFVEFIDNDTGMCFHADVYSSLDAVNELVTMWGNCWTMVTDMTPLFEESEGEPVSAWWVAGEFGKLVAMPATILAGSYLLWYNKETVAPWLMTVMTFVASCIRVPF